jgi:DnaJ family protein C protein 9
MDAEKRKEYDETGRIGDDFDEGTFQAAYNYYRTIYKKVSTEDIESFSDKYRFKEMEK